ncbi:pectinesterase family protein [Paenibacillus crassostreae]|uniref:Pectinesterase n=1 Tax=Paenibacillus crassostreae TaxID=1763538 RepID=A0A167FZ49_9BACL|nr:pectinesterase family protein [Paenibacillus crassostreae]AOZ93926.1 pectin methylesterase [Paenibacillus crassostreae]OAB77042.1 pectin methylesterase [Paenibacillus crassostreae]
MMVIVGKESFCDYHTIQESIDSLELQSSMEPATLIILSGVYEEVVTIYRSHLTIIGLGQVEIRMNRYAKERDETGEEIGTFATPTLFLGGKNLILENLLIANTAGQGKDIGQAVAVYAHCDETVFRNCTFKGYQDTLFTGPLPPAPKERLEFGGVPIKEQHDHYRQLYQNCYIEGTVDFIFGGATAYFERCEIHSLRHDDNGTGYITAASTPEGQRHGYVFKNCFLTAASEITPVFLGRPWREFAKTVFMDCHLGTHIHPLGWDNWSTPANEETVSYQEYGVKEADILRSQRVSWADCFETEVVDVSKENVFDGSDFWKREGCGNL